MKFDAVSELIAAAAQAIFSREPDLLETRARWAGAASGGDRLSLTAKIFFTAEEARS